MSPCIWCAVCDCGYFSSLLLKSVEVEYHLDCSRKRRRERTDRKGAGEREEKKRMGCKQSKGADDSAAARRNRELQRALEQVGGWVRACVVFHFSPSAAFS